MNTHLLSFVAIGIGAALGAWLRWALSIALNFRHPLFPLGTFAANVIGGFLVGIAVAYFAEHAELSPVWRVLVITGFLGGLTTFSSYSAEVISLFERGHIGWALAVASAHLLVSLACTALGLWLYRAL